MIGRRGKDSNIRSRTHKVMRPKQCACDGAMNGCCSHAAGANTKIFYVHEELEALPYNLRDRTQCSLAPDLRGLIGKEVEDFIRSEVGTPHNRFNAAVSRLATAQ